MSRQAAAGVDAAIWILRKHRREISTDLYLAVETELLELRPSGPGFAAGVEAAAQVLRRHRHHLPPGMYRTVVAELDEVRPDTVSAIRPVPPWPRT